ncbi:MAG: VanZ family protein [Sarcina sp.]
MFFLLELLSFVIAAILCVIFTRKMMKSDKEYKVKWQHYFFGYLFLLYLMIALTQVVGFPSITETIRFIDWKGSILKPEFNIIPFNYGIEMSGILNIIFFMPFGFLTCALWNRFRNLKSAIFMGMIFSLFIEISQMFTRYRASDINDIIMNTLGSVIGYFIYCIVSRIFKKLSNDISLNSNENKLFKFEPYIVIGIAIISSLCR